jgi:hypothetical protein
VCFTFDSTRVTHNQLNPPTFFIFFVCFPSPFISSHDVFLQLGSNSNMRKKKEWKHNQYLNPQTLYIHTFSLCLSLHTHDVCCYKNRLFFFSFHFLFVCLCVLWIIFGNWFEFVFLAIELLWKCVRLIFSSARVFVCIIISIDRLLHNSIVCIFSCVFLLLLHLFVCFFSPLQPLVKVTCFDSASDATNTRTVYRSSCSGWRKKIKK